MKVLIVDDGKLGHTQQSMALVALLREVLSGGGLQTELVFLRVAISTARRGVLEWLASGSSNVFESQIRFVAKELDAISSVEPDIIVSCGRNASIVSALYSSPSCVKICILYPGRYALSRFNLIITPLHDSNKFAPDHKILQTTLALSYPFTKQAKSDANPEEGIGVLFGGSNRSYKLTPAACRSIANQLVLLQKRTNAKLYWTASRRTPSFLKEILERELASSEVCATELKDINEFFDRCEWILVSADSISMISQSVAYGRRVSVFTLPSGPMPSHKFKKFIDNLNRQNAITICHYDQLGRQLIPQSANVGSLIHRNDINRVRLGLEETLRKNGCL